MISYHSSAPDNDGFAQSWTFQDNGLDEKGEESKRDHRLLACSGTEIYCSEAKIGRFPSTSPKDNPPLSFNGSTYISVSWLGTIYIN